MPVTLEMTGGEGTETELLGLARRGLAPGSVRGPSQGKKGVKSVGLLMFPPLVVHKHTC